MFYLCILRLLNSSESKKTFSSLDYTNWISLKSKFSSPLHISSQENENSFLILGKFVRNTTNLLLVLHTISRFIETKHDDKYQRSITCNAVTNTNPLKSKTFIFFRGFKYYFYFRNTEEVHTFANKYTVCIEVFIHKGELIENISTFFRLKNRNR